MKLDRRREALLRQTFVDFWQMEKFIERPRILDRAQVWIVKTNVDCGISILKPQAICSNLSASVSRLIVREPFGSFANGYVSILWAFTRTTIRREWIAEDLPQLAAYELDRKRMSLPFPGQYYGSTGSRLESYFLFGLDCMESGADEDALAYFDQCLRLDSGLAAIHSNIGSIRARQGRLEEALMIFRRAAQLDSQSADIQFNIGTTLAMAGRPGEVIKALELAAKMDPGSAETWTNLGNAYLDLDQSAPALIALEYALKLNPGSAVIHNSLGTLYDQQGRADRARRHFEEAIRLQPEYEPAYLNLELLYLKQKDRAQAAAILRRVLALNPANVDARRLLEKSQ